MDHYSELLVGCGISRKKKLVVEGTPAEFQNLTTLDISPNVGADVVWDLNILPYPLETEQFDEIHAYEVLEHFGKQGDYKGFFDQMSEFHRILKPNGYFIGTVPRWDNMWAWGDPGHTRIINEGTLTFLYQEAYGKPPMTDYRDVYKVSFKPKNVQKTDNHLLFVLQKC